MGKKDDSHSARANSGKSLIESVLAPGERNIDSDSVLMWAVRSVRFLGCPADFLTGAGVLGSEELAPGVMVLGIALRLSGACAFGISDSDSDSSKIITIWHSDCDGLRLITTRILIIDTYFVLPSASTDNRRYEFGLKIF